MSKNNTKNQKDSNAIKLDLMLNNLPSFCLDYFNAIESNSTQKTMIAYALDLGVFFRFLLNSGILPSNTNIRNLKLQFLDQLTPEDFEKYLDYLSNYSHLNINRVNTEQGKKRKIISLRNLYSHFYKKRLIKTYPLFCINVPQIKKNQVKYLENNEIRKLINEVEKAENMTKTQLEYHKLTKDRDLAIIKLILGTGIRVSECVNLDIYDLNLMNNSLRIIRRGGYESIIYFDDEVRTALLVYQQQRLLMQAFEQDKYAFFLSLQMRRINIRTVQKLIKKYSNVINTVNTVTPHKLRNTFGVNQYMNTNNMYYVNDILGNKDIKTTKASFTIDNKSQNT